MPADTPVSHPQSLTLCDAHVHIYDCFDLDALLLHAWDNFRRVATGAGSQQYSAMLMLSETADDHWFARLARAAAGEEQLSARWSFSATADSEAVCARCDRAGPLYILAGRQIVSAENLEILALATRFTQADGAPAADIIDAATAAGSLVVLPWGVGKWWGRRGRLMTELLHEFPATTMALGDNSGRPWFLGTPRHFRMARAQHRRLLPGSDPLPFAREAWRPGSTGFMLDDALDSERPASHIRRLLANPAVTVRPYMRCERLLPFVRNQFGMQLRKRFS